MKSRGGKWKPPKRFFSTTINPRAMKLGTHTQVPNTNTPKM